MKTTYALLVLTGAALAADSPATRAALTPPDHRTPAPAFALKDATGAAVSIADYRGKVVLLDFWATWCTGCKKEIPWFSAFQSTYGAQGFAVVGVSLDGDGWKVLRPFLDEHQVPYRMVLGDGATAARYGISAMPDTFLIDRQGRLAAAYKGGLVDRDNIEQNIKALLAADPKPAPATPR